MNNREYDQGLGKTWLLMDLVSDNRFLGGLAEKHYLGSF